MVLVGVGRIKRQDARAEAHELGARQAGQQLSMPIREQLLALLEEMADDRVTRFVWEHPLF